MLRLRSNHYFITELFAITIDFSTVRVILRGNLKLEYKHIIHHWIKISYWSMYWSLMKCLVFAVFDFVLINIFISIKDRITFRCLLFVLGPFWICMTLVFSVAVAGNLANYLYSQSTSSSSYVWKYDFHKGNVSIILL